MKKTFFKSKKFWTFTSLALYLIATLVLIVEASLPGSVSANQSNSLAENLANFLDGIAGDQSEIIEPTSLKITNKTENTFEVGEYYQIETEILPANTSYEALTFSSSNEEIATVSGSGLVKFINGGEVTISVTNDYNNELNDSINFIVKDVYPTSLTSYISSSISDEELSKNDDEIYTFTTFSTYTIHTEILPANANKTELTYKVDDPNYRSYFTLNKNQINVSSTYSLDKIFTLTISTVNNISSTLKFQITPNFDNAIPLEKIEVTPEVLTYCQYTKINLNTFNGVSLNFSPANATYKNYIATSSNEEIVSVTNGSVLDLLTIGTAKITVQSVYYPNIYDEITVNVIETPLTSASFSINDNANLFSDQTYGIQLTAGPSNSSINQLIKNYGDNLPEGILEYTSSDETIAKINEENKLVCLKGGDVTITMRVLKLPGLDTTNNDNYLVYSKTFHIYQAREVTSFEIDMNYYNGYDFYGKERVIFAGVNYNFQKEITLAGFFDKNGNLVEDSSLNTTLEITSNDVNESLYDKVVSLSINAYPYGKDVDYVLNKNIDIIYSHVPSSIKVGNQTFNMDLNNLTDDNVIEISGRLYPYFGEVNLDVLKSIDCEIISNTPDHTTFYLQNLTDSTAINLSSRSTNGTFSITGNNRGEAYIMIRPYNIYSVIASVSFILKVNVEDVVPESYEIIIKKGDQIVEQSDVSAQGYTIYLIGSIKSSTPLYIGDTITIELKYDKTPAINTIEIKNHSDKVQFNQPTAKLLTAGTAHMQIIDKANNVDVWIRIYIMNKVSLDQNSSYTVTKSNDHDGQLNYNATTKTNIITRGYSYKLKLNYTEDSTYTNTTFTSDDESVIYCGNDGTLTPLKPGNVIIRATCRDESFSYIHMAIRFEVQGTSFTGGISNFFMLVRKGIGHFGAFFVLGICSSFFYYLFFDKNKKWFIFATLINFVSGFLIAAITEIIQLFVPGRVGLMSDILLDFSGFSLASGIIAILFIIYYIYKHYKNKNNSIEYKE